MKLHTIIPGQLYQRGDFDHVPEQELRNTLGPLNVQVIVGLAGKPSREAQRIWDWAYRYEKIPDGRHLNQDKVCALASWAYQLALSRHGAILTHCHAGRNRSGLVSALLVVMLRGVTGEEATHIVRQGRPNALANPTFEHFLRQVQGFDFKRNKFIVT